jgi:transportin-3
MVADRILSSPNASHEPALFASQTLKRKVSEDLHELDGGARASLKDSLLSLILQRYMQGPKNILTQLCLALSALVLQMYEWENPFEEVYQLLSKQSETALFIWLEVLPEDHHISVPNDSYSVYLERKKSVLNFKAEFVLKVIMDKISGGAVSEDMLKVILSWFSTNCLPKAAFARTSLVSLLFQCFVNPDTNEVATDLICEVLRTVPSSLDEEADEDDALICRVFVSEFQNLVPRFNALVEDGSVIDVEKNLCRIFTHAAEAYCERLFQDLQSFGSIVEGVLLCCNLNDLDLVPMTFSFWRSLTIQIVEWKVESERKQLIGQYLPCFKRLMSTMMKHLTYPDDLNELTAAQKDDFRSFRHVIGDVLKDSCMVIGETEALALPFIILKDANANSKWQDVESALFCVRALGSEVSNEENQVLPHIMSILPQLPKHSKVLYTIVLVLGRYSDWTKNHPSFIPMQLQFISAGFQDDEVCAASALALKYICESCGPLMVDFLKDLQPFYFSAAERLPPYDMTELTEAMAYIVSSLPLEKFVESFRSFVVPSVQKLVVLLTSAQNDQKEKLINEGISRLAVFLKYADLKQTENKPNICIPVLEEIWPYFEQILSSPYGKSGRIVAAYCRLLKNCILSYGLSLYTLIPATMRITLLGFRDTKTSSYLWAASYIAKRYGEIPDEGFRASFAEYFNSLVEMAFPLLDTIEKCTDEPELLEDFTSFCFSTSRVRPDLIYNNKFLLPFLHTLHCGMTSAQAESQEVSVHALRNLLDIKLAGPYRDTVSKVMNQTGPSFVSLFLRGVTGTTDLGVPSSSTANHEFKSVLIYLTDFVPPQSILQWTEAVLNEMQAKHGQGILSDSTKTTFLGGLGE